MSGPLILSIFPGIDGLGRGFESAWPDCSVVRGPDVLWGGDIRTFHPPAGKFDGVIGGPPCQSFSALVHLIRANGHEPRFGNLIPEFERVVAEVQPAWFLMENVPAAPVPQVRGYWPARTLMLNNRWIGAEQNRLRRFCFGMRQDLEPRPLDVSEDVVLLEQPERWEAVISGNSFDAGSEYYRRSAKTVTSNVGGDRTARKEYREWRRADMAVKSDPRPTRQEYRRAAGAVTSSDGSQAVRMVRYSIPEAARLQGFPEGFLDDAPFTKDGKLKAIANAVPLPMAEAIARAVRRAVSS